jgi:hypothetical protein
VGGMAARTLPGSRDAYHCAAGTQGACGGSPKKS